jgi:signal transduction histidine kinase
MRVMELERGLLDLSHVSLEGSTLDEALRKIAQRTASALRCQRVSLWLLTEDGSEWLCTHAFDVASGQWSSGWRLEASRYPSYARALAEQRTVAIMHTGLDSAARELVADYFEPHRISATLDAPIYRSGRPVGIVCAEVIDGARAWTEAERAFATAVAEIIGALFEQDARNSAERRLAELERRRHEGEKMEALGRMAAAIAHDFNNILAAMSLSVDALSRSDADSTARTKQLSLLRDSLDAGSRLTRRLLSVARAEAESKQPLRIRDVVSGVRSTLENLAQPAQLSTIIDLQRETDDVVFADHVTLEQVLINLVANARDALRDKSSPGHIRVRVRREGTSVLLAVEDDGEGMDEETQRRIFEPFFSTRAGKSNTGLGMATVFRIVESHRAKIDVRSQPGAGAVIELRFNALDPQDER